MGDSTGAHFGAILLLNVCSFSGVPIAPLATPLQWLQYAECEFDTPMCSWSTGHVQDPKQCEVSYTTLNATSIYYKLWQRNRCNFRDFQNNAVNGARSPSIMRQQPNATARSATR